MQNEQIESPQVYKSKSFLSSKYILIIGALLISVVAGLSAWYFFPLTPRTQQDKTAIQSPPPNITNNKLLPYINFPISPKLPAVKSAVINYSIETRVTSTKEYKDLPNQKNGRWITVGLNVKFAPTFPLTDNTLIYFQDAVTNKKTKASFTDVKEGLTVSLNLVYYAKKQAWEVKEIGILQNIEKRNQSKSASGSAQPKTSSKPQPSSTTP